MADPKPNQNPINPEDLGFDVLEGGCVLLTLGKVAAVNPSTDERTGQAIKMIQVEWWGGNSWFVVDASSNLAQVMEGAKVLIKTPATPFKTKDGKSAYRKNGDPSLLSKLGAA